jgi:hypothetical protein
MRELQKTLILRKCFIFVIPAKAGIHYLGIFAITYIYTIFMEPTALIIGFNMSAKLTTYHQLQ